jgi:sulfur carrier protein
MNAGRRIPVQTIDMIEVVVNGEMKTFLSPVVVSDVLGSLDLTDKKGIAVAVNEEVLSRSQWSVYQLRHLDKLIIIKAVAGG